MHRKEEVGARGPLAVSGGAGGGLRQLQLGYHRRDGALQVRRGVERGGDPQHPHCAGNGEGDAVSDEGQMERGRVRARRGVSVCVRTDGDDHRVELLVREDAAQLRRRLCAGRAPRLCRAANCTCTPRSPRGHQRKFAHGVSLGGAQRISHHRALLQVGLGGCTSFL